RKTSDQANAQCVDRRFRMAIKDRAIHDDNPRVALRAPVHSDAIHLHGDLSAGPVNIKLYFYVGMMKWNKHYFTQRPPRAIDDDIIPSLSSHTIVVDHNLVPF